MQREFKVMMVDDGPNFCFLTRDRNAAISSPKFRGIGASRRGLSRSFPSSARATLLLKCVSWLQRV